MDRSGRQLALPDSEGFEAVGLGAADLAHAANLSDSRSAGAGAGFIDILDFGFQWGIPSVDLIRLGVKSKSSLERERVAYTVGTGHTATVIQHETGDETSALLPNGITIALKTFTQTASPLHQPAADQKQDSRASRAQTYATILHELGVFCHPNLSEHPNIVKLLFLGWQAPNPFPVLGMELGQYGSLDYILCATGAGLSTLKKAHITTDVALGLHALHHEGFVHGDLKPGNIVVFSYPDADRQIIAKLTDFGGASRHDAPEMITSLWSAPEVLHGDNDIEWDKSDVYSYGLVVASIWGRAETFEIRQQKSSCILASFVPESLEGDESENFLLIMKSVHEDNPDSALQLCLGRLSETGEDVAGGLLRAVLIPRFWQRLSILDIIREHLLDLGDALERNLNDEVAFRTEQRRFVEAKTRLFKVWSESFRERSREFQEYVLHQLEEEVGGSPDIFPHEIEDIPKDIEENISTDDYLDILFKGTSGLAYSAGGGDLLTLGSALGKGRICFHIALCYLYPLGTAFSLETGLRWLRAAALGGYMSACSLAPILHHHYHPQEAPPFIPERLLLASAGLSRSLPCLEILASRWPNHYRAVLRIIQDRHIVQLEPGHNDHYHIGTLTNARAQGACQVETLGLIDSIKSYHLDHSRRLLEGGHVAAGANEGASIHTLTYLRDIDGASLARHVVAKGANLNAMATVLQGVWSTTIHDDRVASALSSAISRGQVLLAKTIIHLHEERNIPIKDFVRALITAVAYWHHNLVELLLDMKDRRPSLCDSTPPVEVGPASPSILFDPRNLLIASMDDSNMASIENRVLHGPRYDEAYASTLMLLMEKGANPTEGSHRGCPLYRCLEDDDHIALRCFIRYLREKYNRDPHPEVVDPGRCRGREWSVNGHTGLQTCIYSKSMRCFYMLLDEFPFLIEEQNTRGLTALHSATFHLDGLPMLQALLDRGANVLTVSKDNSSPLMRALRNRNIEAANLILRYCSPEQLEALFRRQPDTGRSLFSSLIDAWLRDRDHRLIGSFRWAIDHGAAHFYGTTYTVGSHTVEKPLWNDVLAGVRPPQPSWSLRDLALLNLLFDTFPDRINELQQDGRGPLHVATWYGHVEVVRCLLRQHGADVNLEFGICEYHPNDPQRMLGRTALNLAVIRSKASALPDEVRRGGDEDVARWREDCAAIQATLLEAGARSGSGATYVQMLETLALHEDLNITVFNPRHPEPFEHDERWRGHWPEPLLRDHTSELVPNLDRMNREMEMVGSLVGGIRSADDPGRNTGDSRGQEEWKWRANVIRQQWRLPEGWELRTTGRSRTFYFVDHNMRSTTWNKPPVAKRTYHPALAALQTTVRAVRGSVDAQTEGTLAGTEEDVDRETT